MSILQDFNKEFYGIGMARPIPPHQSATNRLWGAVDYLIYGSDLWAVTESVCDVTNPNDISPDVVIYDGANADFPVFLIEVTFTKDIKNALRKIETKVLSRYPEIEWYVFDYEKDEWYSKDGNFHSSILNFNVLELFSLYEKLRNVKIEL